MAFPVYAALAAASTIPTLFGKKNSVKEPSFFMKNPQELEALIRQRVQSQYGGAFTNIRESLANAGLLASGALPDILTRTQLSQGQDIVSQILNLYQGEYAASRDFQTNKYFQERGIEESRSRNTLDTLSALAGSVGQYYGQKPRRKKTKLEELFPELYKPQGGVGFNPVSDLEDIG